MAGFRASDDSTSKRILAELNYPYCVHSHQRDIRRSVAEVQYKDQRRESAPLAVSCGRNLPGPRLLSTTLQLSFSRRPAKSIKQSMLPREMKRDVSEITYYLINSLLNHSDSQQSRKFYILFSQVVRRAAKTTSSSAITERTRCRVG